MILLKVSPATIIAIQMLLQLYTPQSCGEPIATNLTVDAANEYIRENKDAINQTYRLKYHFMAPIGWINDPNGVVYFKGEYHLFYQSNPYDTQTGGIHWGHAKSKDLIHWEDLPVALAPDQSYDSGGVFSGSAIVKDDKLYLVYTGNTWTHQVQCVAVSEDGINFKKVPENPVIGETDLPSNAQIQDFRDPKVFQRNDTYYIVVAAKVTDRNNKTTGEILLYESANLIKWKFKSILLEGEGTQEGEMWECPDLFELDGKDVLIFSPISYPRSGNHYFNSHSVLAYVGKVDWGLGKFNVENFREIDHGLDYYAPQTLLDDQNRRIAIAWMGMWGRTYPTHDLKHGWVGSMTIPRQLRLKDNRVVQEPISVSNVIKDPVESRNISLVNETKSLEGVSGAVALLELTANLGNAQLLNINLRKNSTEQTVVSYNTATSELTLDRTKSGRHIAGTERPAFTSRKVEVPLKEKKLKLQIFLDQSSIEVFANDGIETLTAVIYPTKLPADGIEFEAKGTVIIESLRFSPIVPNSSSRFGNSMGMLWFYAVMLLVIAFS